MLKTILNRLVKDMSTKNHFVMNGPPNAVTNYDHRVNTLLDCFREAGYKIGCKTECHIVCSGLYKGTMGEIYKELCFYMPFAPETETDVKIFEELGFKRIRDGVVYTFEVD